MAQPASQGRGGYRPTAPQNNFGVSATGGAGNSGKQPIRVAPGGQYGSRTALVQQQQSAPMASSQPSAPASVPTVPTNAPVMPSKPIIPLTAPTERPYEPVTTGVPNSPGAGPEVLHLPTPVQAQYATAYDMFQSMAAQPGASPAIQYLAQRIKQTY